MTLNDQITPELLRIRKELDALNKCTIHVGIQQAEGTNIHKEKVSPEADLLTIARVHEYGCVIHPKRAQNLCIPINERSYDKSPRDFENEGLFFFTSGNGYKLGAVPKKKKGPRKVRSGNGVPVERKPRKSSGRKKEKIKTEDEDDEIEVLFLLLPSVTIPERSFIRAGYDANRDQLAAECQKVIGKIIHEGWTGLQAAEWLGGFAVGLIDKFIVDASNFKPKGEIQKERSGRWGNNPLIMTARLRNSITWKVEGGAE